MHIACQPWHTMPKTPHFFEKNRIYIAFFSGSASRCLQVPFLAHIKIAFTPHFHCVYSYCV